MVPNEDSYQFSVVSARGSGTLIYKWFLNGTIDTANMETLTVQLPSGLTTVMVSVSNQVNGMTFTDNRTVLVSRPHQLSYSPMSCESSGI